MLVDVRLELLGERVLEPVRLGVHGVEREAERLSEVLLEQAVVADDLERGPLALVRSASAPLYGVCSTSPSSASFLIIAVADGGETPIRRASVGRRRALAGGMELVQLLEVVLDRVAELDFRHAQLSL